MKRSTDQDTWNEWSKHVLAELTRLNNELDDINKKFDDVNAKLEEEFRRIHVDLAMLKVKSGVWGLLGGLIPILIALMVEVLKK